MISLPLSWTEVQSSFNYIFEKKKSLVHFQAFSPLSSIILNALWATREVVWLFCDGCKCAAFSNIFFHSFPLHNAEIRDKVGIDDLVEGLDVIHIPKYWSLDNFFSLKKQYLIILAWMEFPVSEISRINISLFYINFLVQITYFILAFESDLET